MNNTKIFPQIKTKEFIKNDYTNLVFTELFSNLIVCYLENNNLLTESRMQELGLSKEELTKQALNNLTALEATEKGIYIMDNGNGTKSISYETHDTYDAARILLLFKVKLDFFVNILGDPFLVAIPCRDFLLAAPANYENKLASYANQLFKEKPEPLTNELFLFSKNKETFEKK